MLYLKPVSAVPAPEKALENGNDGYHESLCFYCAQSKLSVLTYKLSYWTCTVVAQQLALVELLRCARHVPDHM